MEPRNDLRHPVTPAQAVVWREGRRSVRPEELVTEEPLEIRLAGPGGEPEPVAVTMRTPGHDFDLAVGFLLGEGILASPEAVATVRYCQLGPDEAQQYNIVTVHSRHAVDLARGGRRHTVTSACGVCGLNSLKELEERTPPLAPTEPSLQIDRGALCLLPDRLRRSQKLFDRTGGLHGAALFDLAGQMLAVREDVGRHNAVDKLIGWAAMGGRLPLHRTVLVVSGRVSFEIVQKAAVAGVPILAAVSAPSSLAVATAERLGMTLAGFVREGRATVYAGARRVSD
jgi:FdhD protein